MIRLTKSVHLFAGLFALTLMTSTSNGHEFKSGDLMIDHPWMRATPAGAKTAGGYLKITNRGKDADTLIGGSAEGAAKFEVHEMSMENNVMKMRHLSGGLEIKPGETVELKPGSYHLMMMGLQAPYKEGEMVKGTLRFEKAGTVEIGFKVEAMGKKMTHDEGAGHKMEGMDSAKHGTGDQHKGH